jgi:hypothetical protein
MTTQFVAGTRENLFVPSSDSFLGKLEQIDTGSDTLTKNSDYTKAVVSLEILKELTGKLAQPHFFAVSSKFDSYLTLLSRDVRFSATHVVSDVRRLFLALSRQLSVPTLPDPQALPGEGGSLSLAWEIGRYQFTLDIFPNRQFDWFWRDSSSGNFTGEEAQNLDTLPPQLTEYFRKAIKGE